MTIVQIFVIAKHDWEISFWYWTHVLTKEWYRFLIYCLITHIGRFACIWFDTPRLHSAQKPHLPKSLRCFQNPVIFFKFQSKLINFWEYFMLLSLVSDQKRNLGCRTIYKRICQCESKVSVVEWLSNRSKIYITHFVKTCVRFPPEADLSVII